MKKYKRLLSSSLITAILLGVVSLHFMHSAHAYNTHGPQLALTNNSKSGASYFMYMENSDRTQNIFTSVVNPGHGTKTGNQQYVDNTGTIGVVQYLPNTNNQGPTVCRWSFVFNSSAKKDTQYFLATPLDAQTANNCAIDYSYEDEDRDNFDGTVSVSVFD